MMKGKLDPQNLTGPQKAAVFLLIMGEKFATAVFRKMTENEIKKVAGIMAEIEHIPGEVLAAVSEAFVAGFRQEDQVLVPGDNFIQEAITQALDPKTAEVIVNHIREKRQELPFKWSREVDREALAERIKNEHPQTIAMILSYLPPEISSEILMTVPDEQKGDIAMRIANLGQVPSEVVKAVDQALQSDLSNLDNAAAAAGGLEKLVQILGGVDRATEDTVLESIEDERNDLANEIREMMFVFEDLAKVDDRGIREILKKVESQQLVLAMKTASEEMKAKILNNLSSRAAEMLKEDLEVMGPVRLAEVEQAQQQIVRAAKELEAEGAIVLGGKGKEDVLV
ncbi:MAG: flagellar motor switch protein FliG [Desulfobacterales bacterium]|jgi:flagellar motor switch protein FliG